MIWSHDYTANSDCTKISGYDEQHYYMIDRDYIPYWYFKWWNNYNNFVWIVSICVFYWFFVLVMIRISISMISNCNAILLSLNLLITRSAWMILRFNLYNTLGELLLDIRLLILYCFCDIWGLLIRYIIYLMNDFVTYFIDWLFFGEIFSVKLISLVNITYCLFYFRS